MRKTILCLWVLAMLSLSACGGQEEAPVQTTVQATQPEKETVTVNGKQRELVDTKALKPGYTLDHLVQFTDFYDFGLPDERPLGFSGQVFLNGVPLTEGDYRFDGYENNTTIVLKLFNGNLLTGNVLTVEAGSVIYYDDQAAVVADTFHATWNGEAWTPVQSNT